MSKDRVGWLRRARHAAEYAAVRLVSAVVGALPERLAVFAGTMLGRMLWLAGARRRRIARQNIERAMPGELSGDEVSRLVKQVFINIGLTAVETLWMRRRATKESMVRRFPMRGIDAVRQTRAEGAGVIVFTLHLGNWELLGSRVAADVSGVNVLARPVNNPLVRAYTTRLRENLGMAVLSTRDGVRPMIKALRKGELLAMLIDQHVNRAYEPVKFFGRDAATTAVVASLALRLNAPVFAGYGLRDGHSFRHRGHIEGPLELIRTGDREADVRTNTQMFNDKVEEFVRKNPEQWLWTHRRWKLADRLERDRRKENAENAG